jgi:hypothetical protein
MEGTVTVDTELEYLREAAPRLDPTQQARAIEVADAIQTAVTARPDIAVSIIGIGLDALSTGLRHDPDSLLDMAPWIALAHDVFAYVTDGTTTDALDALRAGDLGL